MKANIQWNLYKADTIVRFKEMSALQRFFLRQFFCKTKQSVPRHTVRLIEVSAQICISVGLSIVLEASTRDFITFIYEITAQVWSAVIGVTTTMQKIFETNPNFHVKQHTTGKVQS